MKIKLFAILLSIIGLVVRDLSACYYLKKCWIECCKCLGNKYEYEEVNSPIEDSETRQSPKFITFEEVGTPSSASWQPSVSYQVDLHSAEPVNNNLAVKSKPDSLSVSRSTPTEANLRETPNSNESKK